MNISVNVDGAKATFEVEGKLTVGTSPDLETAIAQAPAEASELYIDLTNTTYVSSAGLRVFVAADQFAASRGGRLHLLNPSDEVMEVLDMTGLVDVLEIER